MRVVDISLINRLKKADRDIQQLKNSQGFGKDSLKPKVVQRYKPDGTPTDHDFEGVLVSYYSGDYQWRFNGTMTFTPKNQGNGHFAYPYVIAWSHPAKGTLSSQGSVGVYLDTTVMFDHTKMGFTRYTISGVDGYTDYGGGSIYGDPTVDRVYAKVYYLATDDGEITLTASQGSVVTV